MTDMTMSPAGIDFIKGLENYRDQAYDDGGGKLTIGWGHTGDVQAGDVITKEQAEAVLQSDIAKAEAKINGTLSVQLTQNQFDAMVSVAFNGGYHSGQLFNTSLDKQDALGVGAAFMISATQNGEYNRGLAARRMAEATIFYENIYDPSLRDKFSNDLKQNRVETLLRYYIGVVTDNYGVASGRCFPGGTKVHVVGNGKKEISERLTRKGFNDSSILRCAG